LHSYVQPIAFLKQNGSQVHTPPTENTHCKISSLTLRCSAIRLATSNQQTQGKGQLVVKAFQ